MAQVKHYHFLRFTSDLWKKKRFPLVAGIVIGIVIHFVFIGWGYLNPVATTWLYSGGDLTQHQSGWELYRQSPWSLPLGDASHLVYPEGASVVYSDSIPILAIVMKIFSPIFPHDVQYFGVWHLICIIAMSVSVALILSKFIPSRYLQVLGTILITISPPMFMRIIGHDALASQFLLTAGMGLVVYRGYLISRSLHTTMWLCLIVFAIGIHPYLAAMVISIYCSDCLLGGQPARKLVRELLIVGVLSLSWFWLIGGFATTHVATRDIGPYGADVNALYNPLGFSSIREPMSTSAGGYEGQSYMGLGLLGVVVSGCVILVLSLRNHLRWLKGRRLIALMPIAIATIFSIGTIARLNGVTIYEIHLGKIELALSIFRATGRFMWIVYYLLALTAVVIVSRFILKHHQYSRFLMFLMTAAVALQFADVLPSPAMQSKRDVQAYVQRGFDSIRCQSTLAPFALNRTHLEFIDDWMSGEQFTILGPLASRYNLTLNDANLARSSSVQVQVRKSSHINSLIHHRALADTIYVSADATKFDGANMSIATCGEFTYAVRSY